MPVALNLVGEDDPDDEGSDETRSQDVPKLMRNDPAEWDGRTKRHRQPDCNKEQQGDASNGNRPKNRKNNLIVSRFSHLVPPMAPCGVAVSEPWPFASVFAVTHITQSDRGTGNYEDPEHAGMAGVFIRR